MDKANDLTGAIDAYSDAVNLLDQVLSSETREPDRQSLKATVNYFLSPFLFSYSHVKFDSPTLFSLLHNSMANTESVYSISAP